jgi:hypothetical protein
MQYTIDHAIFLEGIFLKESLKKHYQKLLKYKKYKNLFCTLEPLDWKSVISELKIGHLEQKLLQGILCVYRWMPTLSATPHSYQDREERRFAVQYKDRTKTLFKLIFSPW